TPLEMLVNQAYGFGASGADKKLSGGPSWMNSEHYDIEAAAADPSKVAETQLYAMLRTLLEDRFQLKTHRETREVQGFALKVSKGGAKLQQATGKENGQGITSI